MSRIHSVGDASETLIWVWRAMRTVSISDASVTPMATATIRSTKTVMPKTASMTIMSSRGERRSTLSMR